MAEVIVEIGSHSGMGRKVLDKTIGTLAIVETIGSRLGLGIDIDCNKVEAAQNIKGTVGRIEGIGAK